MSYNKYWVLYSPLRGEYPLVEGTLVDDAALIAYYKGLFCPPISPPPWFLTKHGVAATQFDGRARSVSVSTVKGKSSVRLLLRTDITKEFKLLTKKGVHSLVLMLNDETLFKKSPALPKLIELYLSGEYHKVMESLQ